jgi:hypothetical protein
VRCGAVRIGRDFLGRCVQLFVVHVCVQTPVHCGAAPTLRRSALRTLHLRPYARARPPARPPPPLLLCSALLCLDLFAVWWWWGIAGASRSLELDAKSRDAVISEYNKGEFKPDLFEVVHKVLFQTTDQGSFRRFQQTPAWGKMLTEYQAVESGCLREAHRRSTPRPAPCPTVPRALRCAALRCAALRCAALDLASVCVHMHAAVWCVRCSARLPFGADGRAVRFAE